MSSDERATVFVVDDDPGMRDSLTWLFKSVGLDVETYPGAAAFLDAYELTRPGCLVLDMRLPGMGGLDLLDDLRQRGATLPVIVVTAFGDVRSTVRAMKHGAIDVMEKPASDQVLIDRVQQALEVDRRTRASLARRSDAATRYSRLSKREREVVKLITAGKANKVIAAELGLSGKTVEAHRTAIMRKLGVQSVPDLVRLELLAGDGEVGESSHKGVP